MSEHQPTPEAEEPTYEPPQAEEIDTQITPAVTTALVPGASEV